MNEFKINLSEEELMKRFIDPYDEGNPIAVNGASIDLRLINRIKVFETNDSLDSVVKLFRLQRSESRSPYELVAEAPEWKAMESVGKDVTDRYIVGAPGHKREQESPTIKSVKRTETSKLSTDREKIFVVHGHDNGLKDEVFAFLSELGFDPVVLHRQPDQGQTIIEKFEKHSNVGYALVLLTPDDYGMKAEELSKPEGERRGEFRARQNVIFELGFFIGRLGRQSVCCLFKGVGLPSDINGLIYKQVNRSVEEIGYEIIKELKAAGLHPKLK